MRLTGVAEAAGDVSSLSTEEKTGFDWLKYWPVLLALVVLGVLLIWRRRK